MSSPDATEADPLLNQQRRATSFDAAFAAAGAAGDNATAAQQMVEAKQRQMDDGVEALVEKSGTEPYLNRLMDRRQGEQLYPSTLMVGRLCKGCLIFFVVLCTIGLMTGFLFQGSLELMTEINAVEGLEAPKLMLCPQPWGTEFAVHPRISTASVVTIPEGVTTTLVETRPPQLHDGNHIGGNFTYTPCPPAASFCACIDFAATILHPKKGARAGEYDEWPYVRIEFHAANRGKEPDQQYAFGFYAAENVIPQTWTYSSYGHVTQGDVSAEEVATGKTEFTDGEACPRFGFRRTGETVNLENNGRTVLVFGYDVFLLYVIASPGSKWSVFSLLTLCLMFCAAINNFGLFDIMFPEALDNDDPAQLEPNPLVGALCGRCCMCARMKNKAAAAEEDGAV